MAHPYEFGSATHVNIRYPRFPSGDREHVLVGHIQCSLSPGQIYSSILASASRAYPQAKCIYAVPTSVDHMYLRLRYSGPKLDTRDGGFALSFRGQGKTDLLTHAVILDYMMHAQNLNHETLVILWHHDIHAAVAHEMGFCALLRRHALNPGANPRNIAVFTISAEPAISPSLGVLVKVFQPRCYPVKRLKASFPSSSPTAQTLVAIPGGGIEALLESVAEKAAETLRREKRVAIWCHSGVEPTLLNLITGKEGCKMAVVAPCLPAFEEYLFQLERQPLHPKFRQVVYFVTDRYQLLGSLSGLGSMIIVPYVDECSSGDRSVHCTRFMGNRSTADRDQVLAIAQDHVRVTPALEVVVYGDYASHPATPTPRFQHQELKEWVFLHAMLVSKNQLMLIVAQALKAARHAEYPLRLLEAMGCIELMRSPVRRYALPADRSNLTRMLHILQYDIQLAAFVSTFDNANCSVQSKRAAVRLAGIDWLRSQGEKFAHTECIASTMEQFGTSALGAARNWMHEMRHHCDLPSYLMTRGPFWVHLCVLQAWLKMGAPAGSNAARSEKTTSFASAGKIPESTNVLAIMENLYEVMGLQMDDAQDILRLDVQECRDIEMAMLRSNLGRLVWVRLTDIHDTNDNGPRFHLDVDDLSSSTTGPMAVVFDDDLGIGLTHLLTEEHDLDRSFIMLADTSTLRGRCHVECRNIISALSLVALEESLGENLLAKILSG